MTKNIPKIKTLSSFNHLCQLTTNIEVKRKIFTVFIEPIIGYHMVIAFMVNPKLYLRTVNDLQLLQNTFLRKVASVGNYAPLNELHEYVAVHTVQFKLQRLASNIWQKLQISKAYKPTYLATRRKNIKILSAVDVIFNEKLKFDEVKKSKLKFDKTSFETWQKRMYDRAASIAAGSGVKN